MGGAATLLWQVYPYFTELFLIDYVVYQTAIRLGHWRD